MSVIWLKVWRDLWRNKLRTLLIVLSTAVGVFALGMVFGMSNMISTRFAESHKASIPPHVQFYTSRFDQDVVDAILEEPDVADAEGEFQTTFLWKLEGETDWRDGTLMARADYEAQHMFLIDLLDGAWPGERALAVESMSSEYYGLPIGSAILVEVGRRQYHLPIEGIMRHPFALPPQLPMGDATFCTTLETVAWFTGREEDFNTLNVRFEFPGGVFDEEWANDAAERIQDRLERAGLDVGYYSMVDPEAHYAQETMEATLLILTVLGALSLGLSGFLIINMMNATITQQVWQIGVMKVLGATGGRVTRIYLAVALIYGLLSLFLAVPLGAAGAHIMAAGTLNYFNIASGDFRVMPMAAYIQIAVGLVVPLLAALVPVIGGARLTPHQAIRSYGLGAGFGSNWIDRLIGRIRRLPRPLALSLRNTFRRKARVTLTLLTLVLGGVMFIMVLSVQASFSSTLDVLLDELGFDAQVAFERLHPVTHLLRTAEGVPGVTVVEVWGGAGAQVSLAGGGELDIGLTGVPPDSVMVNPRIVSGRGLSPDDGRAVLLDTDVAADAEVQVGDEIELTIGERESTWRVVGLVLSIIDINLVPADVLAQETGTVGKGGTVVVMTAEHGSQAQERLLRDLRAVYTARRMEVSFLMSADELRQQNLQVFAIITYMMLMMAVLAALVGSIGLMSTMSINVVERSREIGVMRATGASSFTIAGIFVAEGVLVGVLSWLFAALLSYPGGWAFSNVVGNVLVGMPFDFIYSAEGAALWLLAVIVMSGFASLWPALRATRVSVREALSYEG
jgi:putative ABC transport system permease protein